MSSVCCLQPIVTKKGLTEIRCQVFAGCSLSQSLTELVPRLWPFLKHNIMSVRRAALQTLLTLLSSNDPQVRLTLLSSNLPQVRLTLWSSNLPQVRLTFPSSNLPQERLTLWSSNLPQVRLTLPSSNDPQVRLTLSVFQPSPGKACS